MNASSRRCVRAAVAVTLSVTGLAGKAAPSESVYVIVSAQSSVRSVALKELLALYTGRTRTLEDGQPATPLDQERDGAERAFFYQTLTGMDIARINSYWARLRFTGAVQPPLIAGDETAMVHRVRSNPTAIGYLTQPPQDPAVRVVLRLP